MLLEIKLVIVIYCEICRTLSHFSFLTNNCSLHEAKNNMGIECAPCPILFTRMFWSFYY